MYYLATVNSCTDKVLVWAKADNEQTIRELEESYCGRMIMMTEAELSEEDWEYA